MTSEYLADDHISGKGYFDWLVEDLRRNLIPIPKGSKVLTKSFIPDLSISHLAKILSEVLEQITQGKGQERHGGGVPFQDQPWKHILDNVGDGFSTGQALKKIFELKSLTNLASYKREVLGAIAYLCMSLMYKEYINEKCR
jgi:hypothetical protein